jgi:hypothetical protein
MNATATEPSPQHLQALARANRVRLARAELKRRIGEGRISAGNVFLECPWEAASMTVADVLMSQRRWGATRCRKFLFSLHISETRTVGSLTQRQRSALADQLGQAPSLALAQARRGSAWPAGPASSR